MTIQPTLTKLREKLGEALASVMPIIGIVLILCFTAAPLSPSVLLSFLLGAAIGVACIDALPQHAALALLLPISFLLIALAVQCRAAQ